MLNYSKITVCNRLLIHELHCETIDSTFVHSEVWTYFPIDLKALKIDADNSPYSFFCNTSTYVVVVFAICCKAKQANSDWIMRSTVYSEIYYPLKYPGGGGGVDSTHQVWIRLAFLPFPSKHLKMFFVKSWGQSSFSNIVGTLLRVI